MPSLEHFARILKPQRSNRIIFVFPGVKVCPRLLIEFEIEATTRAQRFA